MSYRGRRARTPIADAAPAMDDLDRALLDAWHRVLPRLQAEPAERLRRLARRRRPALMRPPRAWCLALRASDTRLAPFATDAHAAARRLPHTIELDAPLVRRLTAPVRLPAMGEDWQHIAGLLGVHEETLRSAVRAGVLRARHHPRLGGKPGKPVPIFAPADPHRLFDPAHANLRTPPDPRWGTLWQSLADRLPDGFTQTLERHPRTRNDPRDAPGRTPRFRGWLWRCPACHAPVRTVFLPLPPATLQSLLGVDLHEDGHLIPIQHAELATQTYPTTFACHRCHGVRYFDSKSKDGWNHLVTILSGGLLYGSEVTCRY